MSNFNDLFNQIKTNAGDVDTSFEEKGSVSTGRKFKIDEDGVYDAVISGCVFTQSSSSQSAWYDLELKTEDGAKVKTKLFVLNRDGQPYNIDKNGQKKSTFGWNKMASLNYIVNGEWDGLPVPELKTVMVYDYDSQGEIAKELPIVTSLYDKPVTITVKMVQEDGYPDATQSRLVPDIRNFLDPVSRQTSTEKRMGKPAEAVEDFEKSIQDNPAPIDKRDKSKGDTGASKPTSKADAPFSFSK